MRRLDRIILRRVLGVFDNAYGQLARRVLPTRHRHDEALNGRGASPSLGEGLGLILQVGSVVVAFELHDEHSNVHRPSPQELDCCLEMGVDLSGNSVIDLPGPASRRLQLGKAAEVLQNRRALTCQHQLRGGLPIREVRLLQPVDRVPVAPVEHVDAVAQAVHETEA